MSEYTDEEMVGGMFWGGIPGGMYGFRHCTHADSLSYTGNLPHLIHVYSYRWTNVNTAIIYIYKVAASVCPSVCLCSGFRKKRKQT